MFGKFFYGQVSLREAFWKFSVLGLTALSFLTIIFKRILTQTVNYEQNFLKVAASALSFVKDSSTSMVIFAVYIASFAALIIYSIICVGGMWNTYKEYDKSKTLAAICMILVWVMVFFSVKYAIY